MKRYVALATDANPHYAIYAPIVTRLWRRLGYEPILVRHTMEWNTPLGSVVLEELPADLRVVELPRCEPLSVGNTMRVCRLAVASLVEPDALVLTADIDMAPLSRSFFDATPEPPFVLRADMYGPLESASLDHEGDRRLISGMWRFPLCYVGLTSEQWFRILPLVRGELETSVRRVLHGMRSDLERDGIDYDEATLTARLLLSNMCAEKLEQIGPRLWKQDQLTLVAMHDWASRDGYPERMYVLGEAYAGKIADPIDWHMPRPAPSWTPTVIARHWPEESEWLFTYWRRVGGVHKLGS